MRKLLFVFGIIFVIFITGCSNNSLEDPAKKLNIYIKSWEKADFTAMYNFLTDETKAIYDQEEFVERYKKIYGDLDIKDISIQFEEIDKDILKQAKANKEIAIPLNVKMDSMAGVIEFTNDITLLMPEKDKETEVEPEWLIQWNPSLIYPGMEDNGEISTSVENPKRGEIIDKNQMPLALNDLAYEIGVVPAQFVDEAFEKQEIARLLHISTASIDKALEADWVEPEHFVPLKVIPQTAEDTLAQLTQLASVQKRDTSGRNYPAGEAAAHLTGYVGRITAEELEEAPKGVYSETDMIGKIGLEKLYEDQLRGEKGVKITMTMPTDPDNQVEKDDIIIAEKPVKNGERVQLAIDINIQEKMYNTYKEHDVSGTAAAVHPKTGDILALISSPSYDPNELTFGITQDRWDSLMDDPKKPFVNRFSSTYAPGSVIKPVTAAIGLTEGSLTHDEGLTINGLKWGKDSWNGIKVTRVSAPGNPVHLREALRYSDNIYFAQKAVDIGGDNFVEGLKNVGFDKELPIAFPFTASQISNSGDLKDEILLANSSYGQGEIEMNTLHLALTYTAFLNEGDIIKPNLLEQDKKGEVWLKDIMSDKDAERMQEYLSEVVSKGTAKAAKTDDLAISGKTGTAELKQSLDTVGQQNGWFVGYPTEDPDILIAMMMEDTGSLGTSSFVAGNVKDILVDLK